MPLPARPAGAQAAVSGAARAYLGEQASTASRAQPLTVSPLTQGLPAGARRLLKLAVAALARREHGRVEMQRKLARRLLAEESAQDLTLALDRLQAHGLLCDRRMAESLVRTRAQRYGRLRIAQELDRRGLDRDTISAALPDEAQDTARAGELWRRKFGTVAASPLERARQVRYLLSRGFSSRVVAGVLRAALDPAELDRDADGEGEAGGAHQDCTTAAHD
jgi:regulatory protein